MGTRGAVMTASDQPPVSLPDRRRWLASAIERIGKHTQAADLGRRARRAYLDRTQIRNLVRVGETSQSSELIYDYIKAKVGRQPVWRREQFGRSLLEALQQLETHTGPGEAPLTATEHVLLCRLFLRQMAAAYLYSIVTDNAARAAGPAPGGAPTARDTGRPGRSRPAQPPQREQAAPAT